MYAITKVKVKGETDIRKKKPSIEEINRVFENGKEQAIKKWAATLESQRLQLINSLLPEIMDNLNIYILEVTQLNEGELVNGKWQMNLEVSINDAQIDLLANQRSQSSRQLQQDTYLSFIYVAREVSAVEAFDDTVNRTAASSSSHSYNASSDNDRVQHSKISGNTDIVTTTQGHGSSDTRVIQQTDTAAATLKTHDDAAVSGSVHYQDDNAALSVTSSSSTSLDKMHSSSDTVQDTNVNSQFENRTDTNINTSGNIVTTTVYRNSSKGNTDSATLSTFQSSGSVVKSSQGIIYRVFNPQEIDSKVTEIFNKAGIDVVPAYEADITPEQLAFDFASIGEVASSTQKEATDLARDAGLDFLAIGLLDLGQEEIDPVTGQYKIYAKVNSYIMDLRKRFATKICSVGPVQFSGLGENPTVAKTNALIEASTKASQDLVDQLRVKMGM
jgi:hypothetical protein